MEVSDYISEVMDRILNSLGLDEENRQRRIKVQNVKQSLDMLKNKWLLEKCYTFPLYAGSSYEATTIAGLSSDIDTLYIENRYRVIQDMEQWIPGDESLTHMIDEEDCYPSYVKLYRVSSHYPGPLYHEMITSIPTGYVVDKKGTLYLSSNLFISNIVSLPEAIGPAKKPKGFDSDIVLALPCEFFPRSALKWKERQTAETLKRVGESIINEADHCHVVAVGNKSSPNVNLEWRYSFTHLERRLVHTWNNVQFKLYVMMKFILKDLIEPYVPGVISSYHIKTILFWMNEEYKREFFVSSNFNQCLLAYLKNFAETVKSQSLPHYFIEGCNLYYNQMDNATSKQMKQVILEIIDTWPRKLYDIKRRNLGSNFSLVLSGSIPLETIDDVGNKERRLLTNFEMPQEFRDLFDMVNETKNAFCEKDSMEVPSLLKSINQEVKARTSDKETKIFIDFITRDFLCNFAIQFLLKNRNETNKGFHINAVTYIQKYVNDCCIDTRLKVAAFMVFTGDFEGGTVLLDRIVCQMKPYTICSCIHGSCSQEKNHFAIKAIHDNKPTLSEYIKHYVARTVEYTSDMIGHLPKALVYEMFRSTSISPSLSHKYNRLEWYQDVIIQSPVYIDFLRYVIAQSKSLYAESKAALDKMKQTSKQLEENGANHQETNHNVIGYCHMERGDSRSAFGEYKKSLNVKKHHNAAIWQIALLLRRNIRGDQ